MARSRNSEMIKEVQLIIDNSECCEPKLCSIVYAIRKGCDLDAYELMLSGFVHEYDSFIRSQLTDPVRVGFWVLYRGVEQSVLDRLIG